MLTDDSNPIRPQVLAVLAQAEKAAKPPVARNDPRRTFVAKKPEPQTDSAKMYRATITTDRGAIVMDLDPQLAPNTVNNFVGLARDGYYDGLTFHRVVPDFVIQGGCPEGSGRGGPGYKFADEPVTGRVPPRRGRDGQLRPRHERLAVLHLHRRLPEQARARATTSSATWSTAWTSRSAPRSAT